MISRKVSACIHMVIADANAMVCELLTDAFRRRRSYQVAGCATTQAEILQIATASHVDVALISAHLVDGRGRGLEAVQQLRKVQPRIRSVVLLERYA